MKIQLLSAENNELLLQIDLSVMKIGVMGRIADTQPIKTRLELIHGDKDQKSQSLILELSPEEINKQILEQYPKYFEEIAIEKA